MFAKQQAVSALNKAREKMQILAGQERHDAFDLLLPSRILNPEADEFHEYTAVSEMKEL
jgi:hypothetical protein